MLLPFVFLVPGYAVFNGITFERLHNYTYSPYPQMSTTSLEVEIQQYQGQQNEMRMMIVDIESTIARGHNDHYAGTLKVFKAQLREAEDRLANAVARLQAQRPP